MKVTCLDAGREPRAKPNPNYPKGIDLDVSEGAKHTCVAELPYPAKRCGTYVVQCEVCGYSVACTTAGRIDDPKSIKLPCQLKAVA